MTTQKITDLHRAWIDAMWDELCSAVERSQVDGNHDIEGDLQANIAAGPQSYVDGLYTDAGVRRTYCGDRVMDRKSLKAEEAALVLIGAEEGAA